MQGVTLKLRTADGREIHPDRGRFQRPVSHGRLASPLDSPSDDHVRCACDDCGAHLLGTVDSRGHASGVCLVCGGVAVRVIPR